MSQQPFVIEKTYDAPIEKVWKALTDKEQMKEWYFNLNEFKPEVGFEFEFSGKGNKGEHYLHKCKILEVVPNQKLSYSWSYENYEGYSVVTFELFEEENATRLKLTHSGLDSFPKHPDFAPESFAKGWTTLIGTSLNDYLNK